MHFIVFFFSKTHKYEPESSQVPLCWPPTSWTLNFPRQDYRKRDFLDEDYQVLCMYADGMFVVLRSRGGWVGKERGGEGGLSGERAGTFLLLLFSIIYFLCLTGHTTSHFLFLDRVNLSRIKGYSSLTGTQNVPVNGLVLTCCSSVKKSVFIE